MEKISPDLLRKIINDELPWENAWTVGFDEFSKMYTLHDSGWIGVFLPVVWDNAAVLGFFWDGHWLPEPLRSQCKDTTGTGSWPFLFIRLNGLRSVQVFGFDQSCDGRGVGSAEYSASSAATVLKAGSVFTIHDFIDGKIQFEFTGAMAFLALDEQDGTILQLD